ncbi:Uma2 family endonuclease [Kitasatospora purpeofusca]|uniref:Uma2 family endonuclease n=1 Tax=Kitasatospora purpeofusca TaxID=67352 RepID=UPI0036D3EB96
MDELPEWMYPPRLEGWFAEDLDLLSQAPPRTELWHGCPVFFLWPLPAWHGRVVSALAATLGRRLPGGAAATCGAAVTLDRRNLVRPDIVVTSTAGRRRLAADEALLVVEVVSPDSAVGDQCVKLRKYAEAGIPHYWVIEEEDGLPVVHAYELDRPTSAYVAAGIFRKRLERPVPFPLDIDLDALVPAPRAKRAGD